MHRVGHRLPPFDLRVGPQARRRGPAKALLRDAGGFGNDKPRRGALAVIFARELVRHEARSGEAAGERRHDDAVRRVYRAQLDRIEPGNGTIYSKFTYLISEERRVGKECVNTGSSRWTQYP